MCKICKRDSDTLICKNCSVHLAQLSVAELRSAGCQIKDELSFSDSGFPMIHRYCAIPVSINSIEMTLKLVECNLEPVEKI